MNQKTHGEKLQELDIKINQLEARKERMANRFNEQERKKRTRRLIQVGAIFEKYFEIEGEEQAEKIALATNKQIKENKDRLMEIDIKQSIKQKQIIYETNKKTIERSNDTNQ